MANCLVVGANGFLGSHLVDALAAQGHTVTAFDRFTEEPRFKAAGVVTRRGDFLNRARVSEALAGQDQLFHFLSTTTPVSSEDDPVRDIQSNVLGSIDLLETAVEAGIKRVNFASTGGAIYGDQGDAMITEDAVPSPMSPYAIGKLAIEGYLRYFQRKHGLDSVSWRISNPYGPRQHPHKKQGVIPIFLHRIAEGLPVQVFGDGSMTRDFVFVDDVVRMIASTVESNPQFPVYNIGSGHGTSVNDVLALARRVTGRDVVVETVPQPVTFVQRSIVDPSRYSTEFGQLELVALDEGMARTWEAVLGET